MIYLNLLCVPLCAYGLAVSDKKSDIVVTVIGLVLNMALVAEKIYSLVDKCQ